jgi:LAO/AO transport system kinase
VTTTTPVPDRLAGLLADFDAGKPAALARAVSLVENQREGFEAILAALHPRIGRARRIGVTGPP